MARPGADLFVVLGISTSEEGNQHAPEFPSLLCFLNRSLLYVSSYVAILLEYIFVFDAARIILTTRTTRVPPLAVTAFWSPLEQHVVGRASAPNTGYTGSSSRPLNKASGS